MKAKKVVVLAIHAFVIWALCGVTIAIGKLVTTLQLTLIIHAFVAPAATAFVSIVYYKKFNYSTPIQTALFFLLFTMVLDAGLVAPVFERSYDMFRSALGTWIPFSLIFLSSYIAGLVINRNR